jgi:4'-phosphopantetheinyl transferase
LKKPEPVRQAGHQSSFFDPQSSIPRELLAGEVHVWKVPLASVNAEIASLRGILSAAEQERASRFAFEKDQARFVSCRASLRILLGRYTGVAPRSIVFRYEPQGKPALSGLAGWQFNVSHSRDLAAIAISRDDAVGIDLELINPDFPRSEVAPDILGIDELRDLAALPGAEQAAYFFQLWTLKEALLKSAGSGFSLDPREIRVRLGEGLEPAIISGPPQFIHASLRRFSLHPGYAGALAVLGRVSELAFFDF